MFGYIVRFEFLILKLVNNNEKEKEGRNEGKKERKGRKKRKKTIDKERSGNGSQLKCNVKDYAKPAVAQETRVI